MKSRSGRLLGAGIMVVAAIFLLGGDVFAGKKNPDQGVTIYDDPDREGWGWASGVPSMVRATSNTTEYIMCYVSYAFATANNNVACEARNSYGKKRSCTFDTQTTIPEYASMVVAAMSNNTKITFYWDADQHCTLIKASNDSRNLP
jgi:hypothetical protein